MGESRRCLLRHASLQKHVPGVALHALPGLCRGPTPVYHLPLLHHARYQCYLRPWHGSQRRRADVWIWLDINWKQWQRRGAAAAVTAYVLALLPLAVNGGQFRLLTAVAALYGRR